MIIWLVNAPWHRNRKVVQVFSLSQAIIWLNMYRGNKMTACCHETLSAAVSLCFSCIDWEHKCVFFIFYKQLLDSKDQDNLRMKHAQKAHWIRISLLPFTWSHIRVIKEVTQRTFSGFWKSGYELIRVIEGVYMNGRNRVIPNIPVRKGLEERYCVHVNVATVCRFRE